MNQLNILMCAAKTVINDQECLTILMDVGVRCRNVLLSGKKVFLRYKPPTVRP
jgi:hypothetical protein